MDPESEPSLRRNKKLKCQFLIITILIIGVTIHLTSTHFNRQPEAEKPKGYITANLHITPIETLINQTIQLVQNASYSYNELSRQDPKSTKPDILLQFQHINFYHISKVKTQLDELLSPFSTNHHQRAEALFSDHPYPNHLRRSFEELLEIEQVLIFMRNAECLILPKPTSGPFLHQKDYDQLHRDYQGFTGSQVPNKLDLMIEYHAQLREFILRLASEVNYVSNIINTAVQNQTLYHQTLDANEDKNLEKILESSKQFKTTDIYKQKLFYILYNNMFIIRIPIF